MLEAALLENSKQILVFCSPPDKETAKLLKFLKVKVRLEKPAPGMGTHEILVAGGGPISGLKQVLTLLGTPAPLRHFIPQPDCSEQLWVCGGFAVRMVSFSEDLFAELRRGKHRLCVLDAQALTLRAGAEKAIYEAQRAKRLGRKPSYNYRTSYSPLELVPKLVKLSRTTRYVITAHMKGFGIAATDKAQYLKYPQVLRVMGRTDTAANKKVLMNLARDLYRDGSLDS